MKKEQCSKKIAFERPCITIINLRQSDVLTTSAEHGTKWQSEWDKYFANTWNGNFDE